MIYNTSARSLHYSANQIHDFWVILHFQLSHKLVQTSPISQNQVEKFITVHIW